MFLFDVFVYFVCDILCGVVCLCLSGCLRLCVMLFVRVVFGKLNVCCFVMSVIYGVRCCDLCLFVCVVCE